MKLFIALILALVMQYTMVAMASVPPEVTSLITTLEVFSVATLYALVRTKEVWS